MRCIIAGCRHVIGERANDLVWDAINDSGWSGDITEIVHGGARGVDAAAGRVCDGHWPIRVFAADWTANGVLAGPIRNREMAKYADALIAIWDGNSRGTANMIHEARRLGLKVYVRKIGAVA